MSKWGPNAPPSRSQGDRPSTSVPTREFGLHRAFRATRWGLLKQRQWVARPGDDRRPPGLRLQVAAEGAVVPLGDGAAPGLPEEGPPPSARPRRARVRLGARSCSTGSGPVGRLGARAGASRCAAAPPAIAPRYMQRQVGAFVRPDAPPHVKLRSRRRPHGPLPDWSEAGVPARAAHLRASSPSRRRPPGCSGPSGRASSTRRPPRCEYRALTARSPRRVDKAHVLPRTKARRQGRAVQEGRRHRLRHRNRHRRRRRQATSSRRSSSNLTNATRSRNSRCN